MITRAYTSRGEHELHRRATDEIHRAGGFRRNTVTNPMISVLSYVMSLMASALMLFAAAKTLSGLLRGGTASSAIQTLIPAGMISMGLAFFPKIAKSLLGAGATDKDGNPLSPFIFGDTSETPSTSAASTTSVPPPATTATPTTSALPSTANTTAPSVPSEPAAPVIEWSTVGPLLAAAAGLAVIGLLAYFGGGALRHRLEERRAEMKAARLEAQKAATAAAEAAKARKDAWEKARSVLNSVKKDYTDFENNMRAVILERAFLADITTPATAAFHLDYDKALELDMASVPEDQGRVDEFVAAAAQARRSFDAANRFAEAKYQAGEFPGGYRLQPEQTERLLKTITLAIHENTPAEEAAAAMRKVNELAQQWGMQIPKNIRGEWRPALEAAERFAITA